MAETGKKPKILFLFTDQQRFDTINAAGFSHMITPNLDRLVREGCLFSNACTPNPVCIPARHNIITGLTARHHGYYQNINRPMTTPLPVLPRILSDNDYITRAIGKMHFQPPRRHHGFDRMELMEEIPRYREADDYAMYLKSVGLGHIQNIHGVRNLLYMVPQRSLIPEEHHGSAWVGSRTVEFLKNNYDRQFFLWSSWIAPHPPFDVPGSFADLYEGRDIPEPAEGEADLPEFIKVARKTDGDIPGRDVLMRMRRLYYASISFVDKNIGRILDTMEELGILDETIVIFTSDHGEMLGDHGLYQKSVPWEPVCRVPLIIRWPERIKPGTVRQEFADLNDILPTLLDAAGISYPGDRSLPGESLLAENPKKDRSLQYIENGSEGGRWISIKDKRYQYVYFYCGRESLYDLREDPRQNKNLLEGTPGAAVQKIRKSMKGRLVEYEEKYGLENHVRNGDFRRFSAPEPFFRRNGQFPKFPLVLNDPEEKAGMNSIEEEISAAVKDEPLVDLKELDLDTWIKNGGSRDFAEKIKRGVSQS